MTPRNLPAEDFAKWVLENKPHLLEIENEILAAGNYGEIEIKIHIRGGRVEKLSFWKGRTWLRDKANLTHLKQGGIK